MSRGVVVAICIAPDRQVPMQSVPEVRAYAGEGLEGDRYHAQKGTLVTWMCSRHEDS